jgi:two-component system, OmpR family, sensor histidine kinase MprB
MTLRTRIALVASLAVGLTVVAVAGADYAATRAELRNQVDSALSDRAQRFMTPPRDARLVPGRGAARGPRPPGDGRLGPPPGGDGNDPGGFLGQAAAASPAPFGGASGSVQFVTPAGRTIVPPDENSPLPVSGRTKRLAATGRGSYFTDLTVRGTHVRVLTVGGSRGAVQVARPLTEVDHVLSRQLLVLIAVGGAGILLAAGLGFVVARTALRPISHFTRRTEALTATPDLSQRLPAEGRDELARLAQSFNTTLDALEQSVEAQRHLVADASHELRTPIASLRANIQVLEDADRLPEHERAGLRADIIEELDELTALVGDVVELARGTKREEIVDDVRLDEIAEALTARARRRAGDGLSYTLELEPTLVTGAPERISRAVSNLLDNARKWSPPGGTVEVSLAGGTVTVRDHGPGFRERDLPHVFERFYRADEARAMTGSGLGLAIVRQAAEAHGGFAEAANAPGGGALLRVNFGPATPVPRDVATHVSGGA